MKIIDQRQKCGLVRFDSLPLGSAFMWCDLTGITMELHAGSEANAVNLESGSPMRLDPYDMVTPVEAHVTIT